MRKTIDLSPKMTIPSAEAELTTPYVAGELPLGQSMGGLQMFSNVFKRGNGDSVFGSDENGIWLGAADFANAIWRVSMAGLNRFQSQDGHSLKFSAEEGNIQFCDENDVPVGVAGFANLF